MKSTIIWNKKMKTVEDVITELQKLDPKAKVEAEGFPERDKPLLTIWEDGKSHKISLRLGW